MSKLVGPDGPLKPLLEVRDLRKWFPIHKGLLGRHVGDVKAVDGVDFDIYPRETLGVVGESGCGKTTVGRTVLRLIEPTSGTAVFDGKDVFTLPRPDLRALRRHMQIIFQDPYSSLNPRMTVGAIIGDALELHGIARGDERFERAKELLERVGLQGSYINRYPHEFSGGQRQRIGIARAVALNPKFIVCDESVSALDVSVQAQILNLLMELQRDLSLSYMFIAHDLSVVKHISDRVAVMYLGRIVEMSVCEDLYENPLHPYTQALLSAIPQPVPGKRQGRVILQGDVPNPIAPPPGCHFHTRCPLAFDRCKVEAPVLVSARDGHRVACHLYDDVDYPAEPIPIGAPPPRPAPRPAAARDAAEAAEDESLDGFSMFAGSVDAERPVGIPAVLKDRAGMMLGPFGEIIDPEDSFIATAEIPTVDAMRERTQSGAPIPVLRETGPAAPRLEEDEATVQIAPVSAAVDPDLEPTLVGAPPLPPPPNTESTGAMPPIYDEDGVPDDVSLHASDAVPALSGGDDLLETKPFPGVPDPFGDTASLEGLPAPAEGFDETLDVPTLEGKPPADGDQG